MISPDIAFYPNFLDLTYAQNLFGLLVSSTPWRQDTIVLFGKPVLQPRLVAFYADEGVRYAYSGHHLPQTNWIEELLARDARQLSTRLPALHTKNKADHRPPGEPHVPPYCVVIGRVI
jgi:hypothetical protein